MTNGQIAQLQDLSTCWNLPRHVKWWIDATLAFGRNPRSNHPEDSLLTKREKEALRSLTHQYRHQIAAMRKNREKK